MKQDSVNLVNAQVAQRVEHFLGKEEVAGSSPVLGSTFYVLCICTAEPQG